MSLPRARSPTFASPAGRNRFFGYIYMSASAAYIVGPLVGGKLADPQHHAMVQLRHAVLAQSSSCSPITAAATAIFFRETHSPGTGQVSFVKAFAGLADVVNNHRLRRLYW